MSTGDSVFFGSGSAAASRSTEGAGTDTTAELAYLGINGVARPGGTGDGARAGPGASAEHARGAADVTPWWRAGAKGAPIERMAPAPSP